MSEASPPSSPVDSGPAESGSGPRKRNLIIVAALVPVLAFFALLAWAVAQSGGSPGGFGINSSFGEIDVEQQPAPGFTGEDLAGGMVSLADLKGKVVMLDFWSSWCPPCRQEAPDLARVYSEYAGKDVEFVGIAIWDDPGKVSGYVEEFNLTYPNVIDEKGQIAINYGVAGIPEKFFIDSSGNVVRKFVGPMDPDALKAALDSMLGP